MADSFTITSAMSFPSYELINYVTENPQRAFTLTSASTTEQIKQISEAWTVAYYCIYGNNGGVGTSASGTMYNGFAVPGNTLYTTAIINSGGNVGRVIFEESQIKYRAYSATGPLVCSIIYFV